MLLVLEDLIINQPENPEKEFWNAFLGKRNQISNDLDEAIVSEKRTLHELDGPLQSFFIPEVSSSRAFSSG